MHFLQQIGTNERFWMVSRKSDRKLVRLYVFEDRKANSLISHTGGRLLHSSIDKFNPYRESALPERNAVGNTLEVLPIKR